MKFKQFLLVLTLYMLGGMANLLAQSQIVDVVYLKSGEQLKGKITAYEPGNKIVILQSDGIEVEVPDSEVSKILQDIQMDETGKLEVRYNKKDLLKPKNRGLYNSTLLAFAIGSGSDNRETLSLGAGINNVTGYQWSPLFGLGIGVGLDNYARRGETLYPVYLEYRGYFSEKNRGSFYYALAGGYGFAFKRENLEIEDAEGGWMAHPVIGYRSATSEGLDVNVDLGVKFQKAYFVKSIFGGNLEVRDLIYRRITLRVGMTLWK